MSTVPHRTRLLLFGKRPLAGHVKTRMTPPLSPEEARTLYVAFFLDQLEFVRSFAGRCAPELWIDGELEEIPELEGSLGGLAVRNQGEGDLGERMVRAVGSVPDGPAILLGVDAPSLPRERVDEAVAALERGSPAVLCGAEDGGYVLLGVDGPRPGLFRDIAWGTSRVAEATFARAAGLGIEIERLSPWYDVDEVTILPRLARDLKNAPRRAPRTAGWLDERGFGAVP